MEGKKDKVCLLNKALYGLKQALRAWYSRIDAHLKKMGFKRSLNEATLYIKKDESYFVIISLYVDDLLVTGSNVEMLREFKKKMAEVFEMTDLGEMTLFLGMEIQQNKFEIFICQERYANKVLKKFAMENCKEIETPLAQNEKLCRDDGSHDVNAGIYRSLIGCSLYLTATRPDIMFTTSLLSIFMQSPKESHFKAVKDYCDMSKLLQDMVFGLEKKIM